VILSKNKLDIFVWRAYKYSVNKYSFLWYFMIFLVDNWLKLVYFVY